MCDTSHATPQDAADSAPRLAPGDAVDPILLQPVDDVRVTVLMDNTFDALLVGDERATRVGFGDVEAPARQFAGGRTAVGLLAEHGFSALVTVVRDGRETSLLFDAGLSSAGIVTNADRLGVRLDEVQGVILSHGHFDHAGGLAGMAGRLGPRRMPMTIHPFAWTPRRVHDSHSTFDMPTLSKKALMGEGFDVIERSRPSLLVDDSILITGEIDRTTEFEHGMPLPHEAWNGGSWRHDPEVIDDQALVVHLKGRGLIVLTGCGHAGVINIVRHAQRLTGVVPLHALLGGFHLSGPAFEPNIAPTVAALSDLAPRLIAPGHCTGWRAQHALAAAMPDAWITSSSGTTYHLAQA